MVRALGDLGSEGREFEPWLVHPHCVRVRVRKTLFRQTTLTVPLFIQSSSRCINGNQQIAWEQPDKMLGGNLQ